MTAQPVAGLRRVLTVLCITEITSWGVLYYAFPVLAPTISTHTGWSPSALTAAFSLSLVVAAAVGVPVGRLLDRYGPRAVMTAGSVMAVPALIDVRHNPVRRRPGLGQDLPSLPVPVWLGLIPGGAVIGLLATVLPAHAALRHPQEVSR